MFQVQLPVRRSRTRGSLMIERVTPRAGMRIWTGGEAGLGVGCGVGEGMGVGVGEAVGSGAAVGVADGCQGHGRDGECGQAIADQESILAHQPGVQHGVTGIERGREQAQSRPAQTDARRQPPPQPGTLADRMVGRETLSSPSPGLAVHDSIILAPGPGVNLSGLCLRLVHRGRAEFNLYRPLLTFRREYGKLIATNRVG